MYYYVEITCLPEVGISTGFLMGKVMDVLHLCLVNLINQLDTNPVGIGFPEYKYEKNVAPKIGTKIRLFSRNKVHLENLNLTQQLQRLEDYINIKGTNAIDYPNLAFAIYKRVQFKSSKERLIRRQRKRTDLPESVFRLQYQLFHEQQTTLPFIQMRSHSSTQTFRLFVEKQTAEPSKEWHFSTYGLSSTVPIPDF